MRIAFISDIHGNLVSLEAVLEDIQRERVDKVICLGDLVTLGPRPQEVVNRLRILGYPSITGNHETYLFNPSEALRYETSLRLEKPWFVKTVNWARDQLSSNNLAYLNAFSPSLRLTPNAGVSIYCLHGTLRSNEEGIFPNTPDDELENMIPCNKSTAVVCGHTHVQMYRLHKGIPIVNVGSVGMPFGYPLSQPPCYLPWAEYAIIEVNELSISVNLKRVSVDFDAMIEMSEGQEYAGRPYWLKAWRKPNPL